MKMRFKFTLGLAMILIALGVILNLLLRQVLISNMEGSVNNALQETMNSTREYVRYRLAINRSGANSEGLSEEANYIAKYISLNYKCDIYISDMKGNKLQSDGNNASNEIIEKYAKAAIGGKAIVNLKYEKDILKGILSYPLYINDGYLGVLAINKDYTEAYLDYKHLIDLITTIEGAVFLAIFILAFFMINKITKPIIKLTNAVKNVGTDKDEINIKVKSKDEVGVLSKEFINMKTRIIENIQTITNEKEKVEKLERSRREFFNSVTHELKTPLTAISGYAELLLEDMVKEKEFNKRAVERIYSESERLHELVLKLIGVSKGISFIEEEKKIINMGELLSQICEDMNIKAKKYSLQIVRNIKAGYILGQSNRIRELMINVIDNSIKYSEDCEIINVESYIEGNYYYIKVINKGEPIPEEIYNNIFEPFIKNDKVNDEQSRGLGLYICSEIVNDHQGEITIENGKIIKTIVKIPSFSNKLETT
jgi:signal transduction histidine kinase